MSLSLASLSQPSWTVDFNNTGNLLVVVPATRETGMLADRLFFRLMNMPEGVEVDVVFYDTDYKAFRENELGYRDTDFHYGSRAYVLAKRLASDKIRTYAVLHNHENNLKETISKLVVRAGNVIFYGLSSSNYKTHFFSVFEHLLGIQDLNILGVYLNGNTSRGLDCRLVNQREDAVGIVNRPFDDSLQTQMTISMVMFNVLNKWVSNTKLVNKKMSIDLSTGEIMPER